jgi:hypothetical protein
MAHDLVVDCDPELARTPVLPLGAGLPARAVLAG